MGVGEHCLVGEIWINANVEGRLRFGSYTVLESTDLTDSASNEARIEYLPIPCCRDARNTEGNYVVCLLENSVASVCFSHICLYTLIHFFSLFPSHIRSGLGKLSQEMVGGRGEALLLAVSKCQEACLPLCLNFFSLCSEQQLLIGKGEVLTISLYVLRMRK